MTLSPEFKKSLRLAQGQRKAALQAVAAAVGAVDPANLVRSALRVAGGRILVGGIRIPLDRIGRIVVVGGGKAAGWMAVGLERVLGDRINAGVVVVPEYERSLPRLAKIRFAPSTHPIPTEKGARATEGMLGALQGASKDDLVVCLISGGGSALMPLPLDGLSVEDLRKTTGMLLDSGAEIREINCVRKHLSKIAGGRLISYTRGARVLSLIVSDVVGDDLSSVASGPTAPDPTDYRQAEEVLAKFGIWGRVPSDVRREIRKGIAGRSPETLKPSDSGFKRVDNVLIGSNRLACSAAASSLRKSGYVVPRPSTSVTGEASVVGKKLARLALRGSRNAPFARVWGGETTVTVRGDGLGGRNQEVALAAAIELHGSSDVTFVSFGTDGRDGPTDAAGAMADSSTFGRAADRGLAPEIFLRKNDSHTFFESLGDLIVTGPTGTNVNDVMMALRRF